MHACRRVTVLSGQARASLQARGLSTVVKQQQHADRTQVDVPLPKTSTDKKGKKKEAVEQLPVQEILAKDTKKAAPPKADTKGAEAQPEYTIEPFNYKPSNKNSQSSSSISLTSGGLPMPSNSQWALPHIRHPFNTHAFVARLEDASFTWNSAHALMRSTKQVLTHEESKAARDLVGKGDLENEAYLFRAALDELRTEVQVQARNDGIALRSANGILEREVDSFNQRVREEIHDLKNNIQIEFNNRKEESTGDQKSLELLIMDVNNKLSVAVGDFRSELEVKKWQETRRCLVFLILGVLAGMVYLATEPIDPKTLNPPSHAAAHVPTAEELGLRPDPYYTGSLKRVGEEESESL